MKKRRQLHIVAQHRTGTIRRQVAWQCAICLGHDPIYDRQETCPNQSPEYMGADSVDRSQDQGVISQMQALQRL